MCCKLADFPYAITFSLYPHASAISSSDFMHLLFQKLCVLRLVHLKTFDKES